jgi:hypothetical protein
MQKYYNVHKFFHNLQLAGCIVSILQKRFEGKEMFY